MEDMMTLKDAARYLNLGVSTLHKLVQKRQIACYRFPKPTSRPRFSIKDLDAFVKSRRIEARPQAPRFGRVV